MTHNFLRSRAKAVQAEPSQSLSSPFAHSLLSSAAALTCVHEFDSSHYSSSLSTASLCSEGESASSSMARKRVRETAHSWCCEEGVSAKKNRSTDEEQDHVVEDTEPLSSPSDDPADCEEALPSTRAIAAVKREAHAEGLVTEANDGVVLNWERIVERFDRAFDQNFSTNKKAHFDSLPAEWSPDTKIVDGARGRWRRLLALDALLYLLQHEDFDLSFRRNFNQQRQLVHCIFSELHTHSPRLLLELLEARGAEQEERDLDVGCARVNLDGLPYSPSAGSPSFGPSSFAAVVTPPPMDATLSVAPRSALARSLQQKLKLAPVGAEWRSLAVMKEKLGADVPAKSRRKFENCVNALCGHTLLVPHCTDLTPILLKAIERALFLFPVLASVSELATETQRKIFGRSLAEEETNHGPHLDTNKTKKLVVPLSTRRSRPVSLSSYTFRQQAVHKKSQTKRDAKKRGAGKKRRSSSFDTSDSEDHEEVEIDSDSEDDDNKINCVNDSDDEDGSGNTRTRRKSEKRRQMEATRERFKQALKISSSLVMTTKTFVVTPDNTKEDTGPSTWFTAERDFEPLIAFLDDDSSDESNDAFSFRFDAETEKDSHAADLNDSYLTQKVTETIPEENESLNASRYYFPSLSSTHSLVTIIPPSPEPAFDEI